jgi:hypothetical protein
MISYTVTTTVIGVGIGLSILLLIRHDRLRSPYALWWMVVAVAVIFLGLFPQLVDRLGFWLGIHYPQVLFLVLALGLLLLKILTMDLERTHQEQKLRLLAQKVGLLEAELRRLRQAQVKDGHQDGDDDGAEQEAEEEDGGRLQHG